MNPDKLAGVDLPPSEPFIAASVITTKTGIPTSRSLCTWSQRPVLISEPARCETDFAPGVAASTQ
jgi:hypothetical protein